MNQKTKKVFVIMSCILLIIIIAGVILIKIDRENAVDENASDTVGTKDLELDVDSGEKVEEEPKIERGEDGLPDYSTVNPEDFPIGIQDGSAQSANAQEFTGHLKDSGVEIRGIHSYSGIFIENNSDAECNNVALAVLKNTTDKMIALMQIKINAGDSIWEFEASTISPGATVMVQEKNATEFKNIKVNCEDVKVAFTEDASLMEKKIKIEETDDNGIKIINKSKKDIPVLRLFYKLKENDVYIGGITYTVKLENVKAGSEQIVYPNHYLKGNSEVLMIREYDE